MSGTGPVPAAGPPRLRFPIPAALSRGAPRTEIPAGSCAPRLLPLCPVSLRPPHLPYPAVSHISPVPPLLPVSPYVPHTSHAPQCPP